MRCPALLPPRLRRYTRSKQYVFVRRVPQCNSMCSPLPYALPSHVPSSALLRCDQVAVFVVCRRLFCMSLCVCECVLCVVLVAGYFCFSRFLTKIIGEGPQAQSLKFYMQHAPRQKTRKKAIFCQRWMAVDCRGWLVAGRPRQAGRCK